MSRGRERKKSVRLLESQANAIFKLKNSENLVRVLEHQIDG